MDHSKGTGWLKDPPDFRDRPLAARLPEAVELKDSVDLRGTMPRVRNQGDLGSCTANAANSVVEYVERLERDPDRDALSRLWTYWYAREKIGTTKVDSGAHLRDSFDVLAERGAPREKYWPYEIEDFAVEPSAGERSAPQHRVLEYLSVEDGNETAMLACLSAGYPFAFGFAVYTSFWGIGDDGEWSGEQGTIDGYHAVVCVGYTPDRWIVRNSWGANWGDRGHFYVPRGFMPREAWDCWTVRKVVR